jgi:fluoroacetyl-CoA thioesterase
MAVHAVSSYVKFLTPCRRKEMPIEPGLVGRFEMIVKESDTASASGGNTLPPVLSTPRMISIMEETAHQALLPFLDSGQSSVGTVVNIRHLAATPVGMQVRFLASLLEVDGRRLRFKVEAWDEVEEIGEGEHERFIIDRSKFIDRLQKKAGQGQSPPQ